MTAADHDELIRCLKSATELLSELIEDQTLDVERLRDIERADAALQAQVAVARTKVNR